jgi:hypothetical protein
MIQLRNVFVSLFLSLACCAAGAVTLEPVPGSTPQATPLFAFFPVPIGVIVRDSTTGAPIGGVPVTFYWHIDSNAAFVIAPDANTSAKTVESDPDGRAAPPVGFIAAGHPGPFTMFATAPSITSPDVAFLLTVLPGPATSVQVVSGDNQSAQTGTAFAQPWVVRAVADNGQPVPYAALKMGIAAGDGWANASWSGVTYYIARADAAGLVTTPFIIAGPVTGQGYGYVQPFAFYDNTYIHYYNLPDPVAASAILLSGPPRSVEVGHTTTEPWVLKAIGFNGQPAAGVPVDWVTNLDCGNFGGADRVRTITDANGISTSPLFTGTTAVFCNVWNETNGVSLDYSFDLTVQVFDPELVEMAALPRYVVTRTGQQFRVTVAFTESGYPIYGLPVTVHMVGANGGASATLLHPPEEAKDSNVATFDFLANGKKGYYAIWIKRGRVWTAIPVEQNKH